jgi:hypothetical protein
MQPRTLWRQPEFLKLWAGQTISIVGSLVTQLALGLTAAALLGFVWLALSPVNRVRRLDSSVGCSDDY